MKLKVIFIVILILSVLSSGCSSSKETLQYEGDPEIEATIKVMTIGSEKNLMKDVGDLFNAKYPNIEIKAITYVPKNLIDVLEKEKPDVLFLSLQQYEQLIREGKLYDIDTLMSNDAFALKGVHPEIVSYLRGLGSGKLYGSAANFENKALYYNKDLFDKYNISYPQDQMTWEEIIQLAKRFPAEDGVSGLYMLNLATITDDIAWTEHLTEVNVKNMEVSLHSESYRRIFEMVMDAYESKALVAPDMDLFEVYDPFITGTSAMTVDYYYYINNKINWAAEDKGNKFNLNWDVATAPVSEASRDIAPYFYVDGIVSVNKESEQKQAAWEFVKFVNSEELAKAKSRTIGGAPSTRTDYIYNPEGKRMEAFYNLKPDVNRTFIDFDKFPKGFFGNMDEIINSELKAVTVGAKTLDEAVASMQERGQRLLDQK
ncbi:multiple sugar transport system substrate-binding protein [Fontibacillus phaseoli]|uniref:Multiple sugar transport system substrate-binding protein n=1 Tax=Fontibacillus phaseoli TaxID=1416533 RepID=A0A369BHH7_9BACL|nr:extracellular solute-binding protein [Fontibacillus phaseoli]RCX19134.1 multiple sugar transport system substrate-binding protein [Fontibacillus phaseoli]